MVLDVKTVLAEGQALLDKQRAQGIDLAELLGVARSANEQITPAIQAQGAASVEEERAKQERMSKQDAELQAIRQQSGVFGPAGRQAQTTAKIAAMDSQLEPARAALMQKMNLQFSDDPLGWLVNQITLPSEIQRYNAMWQGRQGLNDALQSDIASSTAAAQLSSATRAQTSDAEAAAALTKIKAATDVAAAQATAETAQRSINMLVQQAAFDKLPFETAKDQLQLKMAAENNALAKAREARDMRLYEINIKRAQLEYDKAVRGEAAREDVEKKLTLAAVALGKQPLTLEQFEMMQRSDPAQANAFMHLMSQMDITKPAGEQFFSYGADLAETVQFLKDRNITLKGEKATLVNQAERHITAQEVKFKTPDGKTFKQLTKEQQDGWRKSWASEFEKSFVDPNAKGSVYNIMTPKGLAETKIGQLDLSKSAIVKTLQKKYETNPMQAVGVEEVLGTAVGLMGAANSPQAVERLSKEVSYIFQARQQQVYANLEPQRVGMQLPEKVQYVYSQGLFSNPLTGTGMFPGVAEPSMQVNLANPTEVKNLLLRIRANDKVLNASGVITPLGNAVSGAVEPIKNAVAPAMQQYRQNYDAQQGGKQ